MLKWLLSGMASIGEGWASIVRACVGPSQLDQYRYPSRHADQTVSTDDPFTSAWKSMPRWEDIGQWNDIGKPVKINSEQYFSTGKPFFHRGRGDAE